MLIVYNVQIELNRYSWMPCLAFDSEKNSKVISHTMSGGDLRRILGCDQGP